MTALFRFMSSPIWLYWIAPGTIILVATIIGVNIVNRMVSDRHDRRLEELRALARGVFKEMGHRPLNEVEIPDALLENLEPLRLESASINQEQLYDLRLLLIDKGLARRIINDLSQARGKWHKVGLLNDLAWLSAPESEQVAAEFLTSSDPEVAYTALAVLANIDTESAYSLMLGGLQHAALSKSRVAAVAETAQPRADVLKDKSYSPDPQLRYWCAYLMGRSRLESTKARLIEMAADEDPFVRTVAAKSLGWLTPDAESSKSIARLLDDPVWHVRAQAAKAVGYLKLEELATKLLPLLSDQNWWVREDTVDALEVVGLPVTEQLAANLESDDRFVRNRSAELLGRLGIASRAIADLSADGKTAEKAADLLVKLGKAEAVGVIETALETSDSKTQLKLIPVVSDIGGERAGGALLNLTGQSKDRTVAAAAKAALEKLETPPQKSPGGPSAKRRAA